MQGIYNYIPETDHVSSVHNVTAILLLQYMVHVMLFPTTNVLFFHSGTFRSMSAVSNMAVFCSLLLLLLLLLMRSNKGAGMDGTCNKHVWGNIS